MTGPAGATVLSLLDGRGELLVDVAEPDRIVSLTFDHPSTPDARRAARLLEGSPGLGLVGRLALELGELSVPGLADRAAAVGLVEAAVLAETVGMDLAPTPSGLVLARAGLTRWEDLDADAFDDVDPDAMRRVLGLTGSWTKALFQIDPMLERRYRRVIERLGPTARSRRRARSGPAAPARLAPAASPPDRISAALTTAELDIAGPRAAPVAAASVGPRRHDVPVVFDAGLAVADPRVIASELDGHHLTVHVSGLPSGDGDVSAGRHTGGTWLRAFTGTPSTIVAMVPFSTGPSRWRTAVALLPAHLTSADLLVDVTTEPADPWRSAPAQAVRTATLLGATAARASRLGERAAAEAWRRCADAPMPGQPSATRTVPLRRSGTPPSPRPTTPWSRTCWNRPPTRRTHHPRRPGGVTGRPHPARAPAPAAPAAPGADRVPPRARRGRRTHRLGPSAGLAAPRPGSRLNAGGRHVAVVPDGWRVAGRGAPVALRYRAVWNGDHPDLCSQASGVFASWLVSKGVDQPSPHEGTCDGEGSTRVGVHRGQADGVRGIRLELTQPANDAGEVRTTALTAVVDDAGLGWLWTEVRETGSFAGPRLVPAPSVIPLLIDTGVDPRVDQVRLTTTPGSIAGAALAGLVRSARRTLPLIVFSHDPAFGVATTRARATTTSRALAGAAQVFVLPPDEEPALAGALGHDLAVTGGSARLYLPASGAGSLRPERHRRVEPSRLGLEESIPARIFAGLLATTVAARRPPPAFEVIRRHLQGGDPTATDGARYADAEIDRLRHEIDDLKLQLGRMEEDLFDTQSDLLATEEELSAAKIELKHLWHVGSQPAMPPPEVTEVSVVPTTVNGAVELARTRLAGVVIPPAACRDIGDLDAHPNGPAWAASTWRGLRALDAYARAGFDGNFKQWCLTSGDPWAWPGNDKKLAMRESETVQTNDRLRRQRLLPVDEQVDPSGAIHMWAHLKIAEGGGPIAPRVYFHDDTRGGTGKVHVGFIGPHRHMENTKTN